MKRTKYSGAIIIFAFISTMLFFNLPIYASEFESLSDEALINRLGDHNVSYKEKEAIKSELHNRMNGKTKNGSNHYYDTNTDDYDYGNGNDNHQHHRMKRRGSGGGC